MPCNFRKIRIPLAGFVLGLLLLMPHDQVFAAKQVKIGVVDFQRVLNLSEAGKRSRKILLASKKQKENELKSVGDELKKESETLKNNILLTDAAKGKKRKELIARERSLRKDFKGAERALQREQMKASESIYTEVQTVISLIAREKNYDFVIEKSTARAILYSSTKLADITDTVIKRYNDISR